MRLGAILAAVAGRWRCPRSILLLAAALCTVGSAANTYAAAAAQGVSLDAYLLIRPRDLPERYRVWLEEEIVWIITDRERDVFLRLDSDAKRDRFIKEFWERRDPTPGTPRNEYTPIHYERLAYANRQFGRVSTGPGWRTDMGRIYILLGEPQTRSRHHNNSAVYPVEIWFYQVDPRLGVPAFFYVVFFREQGMGDFELYSPVAHGPEQLLNPSGRDLVRRESGLGQQGFGVGGLIGGGSPTYDVLRLINPDLAEAAFSLIPGEARLGSPLRSEALIADILQIPERMAPSAGWAIPILTGATETEVRFETLEVEARAIGWLDLDARPFISYVVRAPRPGLNLGEHEGQDYMTFLVGSYLLDGPQRVLEGAPLRVIQSSLPEEALDRVRAGSLMYVDRVPAIAGSLQLELVFENNVSREYGETRAAALVPTPHPDSVTLGQAILCVGARLLGATYNPFGPQLPFQIGQLAMTPTIDGPFAAGNQLYVFHQLLLPEGHAEPVDVLYTVRDPDGNMISIKQIAVAPGEAGAHGIVNQLTGIALDVEPGAYSLTVAIAGRDDDQTLPFTVRAEAPQPIVHHAATPPPTDPAAFVRRAAILRVAGDTEQAIELVYDALSRAPDLYEGLQLQIELLRDGGHHAAIEQLLTARLAESPHDIELLLLLAEATARQGKHYDAVRFYERAVLERSDSVDVLNALAAEYLAQEEAGEPANLERAIELLTRSLTIDASQAGVRTTLERARAAHAMMQ